MQSSKFLEYYEKLNAGQKLAVDTIEGPVIVIAGPGTGKTQILTLRIANIIRQTDCEPSNILALTFTESGVHSMRARLAEIMGSAAYRVGISTFHGFCNGVIQSHPEEFPHIIGSQHITDVEQVRLIERIITAADLDILRPYGDPMYYLRAVGSAIEELKREGVSPERFAELVVRERAEFEARDDIYHTKGAHAGKMKGEYQKYLKIIDKNAELAMLYAAYQTALRAGKWYDYSDMIMEVRYALERNDELRLMLQEQYQYILVDEHQDTNNAQNKVIELLSNFHDDPNLFVVGDDKQAIFRFQGASIENFLYFKKLYPTASVIVLEENYRSTQIILDGAHDILAGPAPLIARASHNIKPITIKEYTTTDAEVYGVVMDIKERINEGVPPASIAILYRDNKESGQLADLLGKFEIPYTIESDHDVMAEPVVKKCLTILRAVQACNPGVSRNDQARFILAVLHCDVFGVPPLEVYKLSVTYRERDNDKTILELMLASEVLAIRMCAQHLIAWSGQSHNTNFGELFQIVIRDAGLLKQILASSTAYDDLETLRIVFNEVRHQVEMNHDWTIADFLAAIATRQEHKISLKKPRTGAGQGVRLMTAHRSKGLEFPYVYIVNLIDGRWGGRRSKEYLPLVKGVFALDDESRSDSMAEDDDERRLFYVALTRAKQSVALSYATHNISGKEQLPSEFIRALRDEVVEREYVNNDESTRLTALELLFAPRVTTGGVQLSDVAFLRERFDTQGLSVTALNNYLSCPWKYFYTNLIRLPQVMTKHQVYGTAVHAALKDFFDARAQDRPMGVAELLTRFELQLKKAPILDHEYLESLAKGQKALTGYLEFYHDDWPRRVVTEYTVPAVTIGADIRLNGKIDKLELYDDGVRVNVVDYKTSKHKSRNEIEGKTKGSQGDIKQQLVFYRLLLDEMEPQKYRMVTGEIDFLEPDEQRRYYRERFEITDDEIIELRETIDRVADEIRTGSFWSARCDDVVCEFCEMRADMA